MNHFFRYWQRKETTRQDPGMLNPDKIASADAQASFTCFPLLPLELRLKIWNWSLRRNRFLHVCLQDKRWLPIEDGRFTNPFGSYRAVVFGAHPVHSKLLRTSAESRRAALEFYRIHIPCELTARGENNWWMGMESRSGIIYINPEHDFIQITYSWNIQTTLYEFLHHMKTAYDPRRVGLLNLAVDHSNFSYGGRDPGQPDEVDPDVRASVRATLAQLREVFLVDTALAGRLSLNRLWSGDVEPYAFYNRSLPVWAKTAYFERLPRDPRPIAEDLKLNYVRFFDPEPATAFWAEFLRGWDVDAPQIRYSYLIASESRSKPKIGSRGDAVAFLRWEAALWSGVNPDTGEKEYKAPCRSRDKAQTPATGDMPELDVSSAFGFWLFPPSILTEFRRDRDPWKRGRTVDLSGHWPELALSSF